ncbi:MAG: ABC transporter ATP-binding protein [Candidatus Tectomicrobia bacterium]|nr:ABC transporter ATP-binding protein [Candidatus Tectomicrobia bacterium]
MALELALHTRLGNFRLDVEVTTQRELLVLFGSSGAGKSLTLQCIAGLLRPDAGRIRVDEVVYFDSQAKINLPINRRRVGYVIQDYALFPHMTVFENAAYGIPRRQRSAAKPRVEAILQTLRLRGLSEHYPHQISGGQRQRVAIARAMMVEPLVLLLDEPFAALDYPRRERLRADLQVIHQRYGMTIVLVTHDIEDALMLGEKILVLHEGQVEQIGNREEVFYRPRSRVVARAFGAKNIFLAEVRRQERGTADLVLEGTELRVVTWVDEPCGVGQKLQVSIRPEEIKVLRPRQPIHASLRENAYRGSVGTIIQKGPFATLELRELGDGVRFAVELPAQAVRELDLAIGAEVSFAFRRESVVRIPQPLLNSRASLPGPAPHP